MYFKLNGPTHATIKLIKFFGCLVLGYFQSNHRLGCGYTTKPKSRVTQFKEGHAHFCVQSKEGSVSSCFEHTSSAVCNRYVTAHLHTVTAHHVYFVRPRCFLFCLCSVICLSGLLDPLLGSSFLFPKSHFFPSYLPWKCPEIPFLSLDVFFF